MTLPRSFRDRPREAVVTFVRCRRCDRLLVVPPGAMAVPLVGLVRYSMEAEPDGEAGWRVVEREARRVLVVPAEALGEAEGAEAG